MKYYILIYTDNLPANVGGRANGPVIRIKNKYRDDKGIHEHEFCHARQWWKTLGLHTLLVLFSKKYKFWCEVQAYKEQLKYSPGNEDLFASFISKNYGLNVSVDEAKAALIS